MTAETISYALVALAVLMAGAVLVFFAFQRPPAGSDGRPAARRSIGGNPDKQVAVSALLVAVLFILGLAYIAREPSRMALASQRQLNHAIEKGEQSYISLCVSCHGPHGEGGVGKPLNVAQFREGSAQELEKAAELLRKTISRGRPGTAMPAWAQEEGGPLNTEQVLQLVALIQHGDWEEVALHAAEAPSQPAPAPGSTGARAPGPSPQGVDDRAAEGRQLFAAKGCAACHGASLQGGAGPNLQHIASAEKIAGQLPVSAENLQKWLADPAAVKPGTAMPKLGLNERDIKAIVDFLLQQQ